VSKLNQLQQNTEYQNSSNTEILEKMKATANRLGIQLDFSQSNVVVTSKREFESVLRILTDYYKEGTFSHAIYGTSAGKRVDPSSE
jgi:3-dehydroquinate dehydratase